MSESMTGPLERARSRLGDTKVFSSPRSRRRFLLHALVVAVLFVAATILVQRYLSFLTEPEALREFIRGYGILAPVVLVLLQAVQVVAAPVPGQVLAIVAGYLFGVWWGTLYNMLGVTIGSAVAFWLSRRFGRGYVETIVDDDALAWFDAVSDEYARPTLFLLFLVPGLPDDVICFAGGLTKVPLWQLVVIAVVGRAPAFFLVNVFGYLLGTRHFGAAFVVALVLVIASLFGYLYRERLLRLFGGE
ncbi:TVP38/TMEM64 family protein [Haloarchaeobius amylolyticus]|uniref:TVP38/TMEM64 family protein n=1 Tax=Haloarchaeobius amylolyticus TaxID=1198296 RepID=UPI002270974F|nr:TVP38/TMEM64 family protein [Haloarchaeobius amylolyticus]